MIDQQSQQTPEPAPDADQPREVSELVSELWGLVRDYVRQETVEPVKAVGRYIAFGVVGAVLVGTGVVFLAVGSLRVLQAETDTTFTGNLSWLPYLIVFAALVAGGAVSLRAIGRRGSSGGGNR